jgi:hypothetical protein
MRMRVFKASTPEVSTCSGSSSTPSTSSISLSSCDKRTSAVRSAASSAARSSSPSSSAKRLRASRSWARVGLSGGRATTKVAFTGSLMADTGGTEENHRTEHRIVGNAETQGAGAATACGAGAQEIVADPVPRVLSLGHCGAGGARPAWMSAGERSPEAQPAKGRALADQHQAEVDRVADFVSAADRLVDAARQRPFGSSRCRRPASGGAPGAATASRMPAAIASATAARAEWVSAVKSSVDDGGICISNSRLRS